MKAAFKKEEFGIRYIRGEGEGEGWCVCVCAGERDTAMVSPMQRLSWERSVL